MMPRAGGNRSKQTTCSRLKQGTHRTSANSSGTCSMRAWTHGGPVQELSLRVSLSLSPSAAVCASPRHIDLGTAATVSSASRSRSALNPQSFCGVSVKRFGHERSRLEIRQTKRSKQRVLRDEKKLAKTGRLFYKHFVDESQYPQAKTIENTGS